jgi:hypothetical protein
MLEAEQTSSPGNIGVGTTSRGINKIMGLRMAWTAKITEYETNKIWRQDLISGSSSIDEHMIFESIDKGTKFTQVYDMKMGGLLKLATPMMVSTMHKEMKANHISLKGILETKS